MSDINDKSKASKRRWNDENAVKRQLKIAKSKIGEPNKDIKQPHRMSKKHAMDCGNPECYICGNPRKTHKDKLTAQEKRLFQDLDSVTDKHSNGLLPVIDDDSKT